MLLIREVFHCRPGKVRPLLEKFQAMNRIMANAGQGNMRLMTDFSGERYWTLVAEFETPGMAEFEKMMQGTGQNAEDLKEMERLMEGGLRVYTTIDLDMQRAAEAAHPNATMLGEHLARCSILYGGLPSVGDARRSSSCLTCAAAPVRESCFAG